MDVHLEYQERCSILIYIGRKNAQEADLSKYKIIVKLKTNHSSFSSNVQYRSALIFSFTAVIFFLRVMVGVLGNIGETYNKKNFVFIDLGEN